MFRTHGTTQDQICACTVHAYIIYLYIYIYIYIYFCTNKEKMYLNTFDLYVFQHFPTKSMTAAFCAWLMMSPHPSIDPFLGRILWCLSNSLPICQDAYFCGFNMFQFTWHHSGLQVDEESQRMVWRAWKLIRTLQTTEQLYQFVPLAPPSSS